jgi:thiaminase
MITAATAKTNTDAAVSSLQTNLTTAELASADTQVATAISQGKYSTWLDFYPSEPAIQAIEALGYSISKQNNNGTEAYYIAWDTLAPETGDGDTYL